MQDDGQICTWLNGHVLQGNAHKVFQEVPKALDAMLQVKVGCNCALIQWAHLPLHLRAVIIHGHYKV